MVVRLLELREKLGEKYGKYELYLRYICKFVLSFLTFFFINEQIGSVRYLKSPIAAAVLALFCIPAPGSVITMMVCTFIVIHIMAISVEAGAVTAMTFIIMLLIYLAFKPENSILMVAVTLACMLNISGVAAVPIGLIFSPIALLPAIYGILTYGAILSVRVNYTVLEAASVRLTPMEKAVYFINSVIKSERVLLLIAAMIVTVLLVYGFRRLPYAYSWAIAIAAGAACYVMAIMIGNVIFGISIHVIYMAAAVILGTVIGLSLHFAYFAVDEARAEYLQYEDDDYVYYVKAIPKYSLSKLDKQVKRITGKEAAADSESISFSDDGMSPDDYFRK